MKERPPIPKYCLDCKYLRTDGRQNGRHNRWCKRYWQPTYNAVAKCIIQGYRVLGRYTPRWK